MGHFPSVPTVLDGPVYTTIPSDKKEYSSECAFQLIYLVFKSRQKSRHFNEKGETELTEKYI